MFTEEFVEGEAVGLLQPVDTSMALTDSAQYLYALQVVYPALKDISTTAGVIMLGEVQPFIDAALHVRKFSAPDFVHENGAGPKPAAWPKPGASPELVNAAYVYFKRHKPLFDRLEQRWKALDLPNGKAGASPEQLTEDESKDPLSSGSDNSSSDGSAND